MDLTAFDESKLVQTITPLVLRAYDGRTKEQDIYRNTLDCFSAVLDAVILDIDLSDWIKIEQSRQTQKTFQNVIGDLHQEILGSQGGWQSLGKGKIVDLVNHQLKIIAEIKNKHNTTKGNHKTAVYDDLDVLLVDYPDYIGYYVEILPPERKKSYNVPFTPPDNKTKRKRPVNQRIRKIDGRSFYAKVTGESDAIDQVFYNLPRIVLKILSNSEKVNFSSKRADLDHDLMKQMFSKAFK